MREEKEQWVTWRDKDGQWITSPEWLMVLTLHGIDRRDEE